MTSNWKSVALGDVCDVIGGGTPAKDRADFYRGSIPWATVRDMRSELITNTEFKITPAAVESSSTNVIPRGNVVIATRVGLGKVCLLRQDTAINQDLRAIIPKDAKQLFVPFLFWWLKSVAHRIVAEGTGATVQGVKLPFVKSLPIPLPPLPVQQRIVAILDEAFAGLATATANAEKYLKNAGELFESYLSLTLGEGVERWPVRRLEEIVDESCSLSYGIVQPGDEYPGGLPIVRPVDMTSKIVRLEGLKRIDASLAEAYSRTKLHGGELLLCVRGTTGAVSIAADELSGANVTRGIVPIRFNPSQVAQRFGYYALLSGSVQRQIREKTYGTALMQINIRDLRKLMIAVPPLAKQDDIGERLDLLLQQTLRLEEIYRGKLMSLQTLKQALLQKAFSGELTSPPSQAIKEAAE